MGVSDKAKPAARAVWHGQGLQQSMSAQFPLLIGFVLLPYSIIRHGQYIPLPRLFIERYDLHRSPLLRISQAQTAPITAESFCLLRGCDGHVDRDGAL